MLWGMHREGTLMQCLMGFQHGFSAWVLSLTHILDMSWHYGGAELRLAVHGFSNLENYPTP